MEPHYGSRQNYDSSEMVVRMADAYVSKEVLQI